jgi:hypothetical protein
VVDKFGGTMNLVRALSQVGKKISAAAVYKWTYKSADHPTKGVIPANMIHDVLKAARAFGVLLTQDDIDPRPKLMDPTPPAKVHLTDATAKAWRPGDDE